jgi:Ca-activated chloride channel family protein
MFEYVYPNWFWGLLLLPILLAYEIFWKRKQRVRFFHTRLDVIKKIASTHWIYSYFPLFLRFLAISILIFSLARPRFTYKMQDIKGKGIDIIISIDVSGSMQAIDFKPVNRLEAAKKIANQFIEQRKNDRIGIVVFSEHAFTKCPLTLDYHILKSIMESIQIDEDAPGTAIGMGLATAVARLKDSDATTKIVILLTDGENNAGEIHPNTAAEIAATYGIKVYPIGIGSKGEVDFPFKTPYGIRFQKVKIGYDMNALHRIAKVTGTDFAREARNSAELEEMMNQINQLEKAEFIIENYYQYQELFWYFLVAGFFFLCLEFLLKTILWKELP